MMQVHLLTQEQAEQLNGQQYATDSYFNPIQDADGNWIISIEEVGCYLPDGGGLSDNS